MKNESGFKPLGYRVLIKLDLDEGKTEGGLYIPDVVRDREKYAVMEGTLVAYGEFAFEDYKTKPKPGDRVVYNRYAGIILEGADECKYRVMDDVNDVVAIKECTNE